MTQVAALDASKGMYDYLRKVVILGPGLYQAHVTVDSETWGEPVIIELRTCLRGYCFRWTKDRTQGYL